MSTHTKNGDSVGATTTETIPVVVANASAFETESTMPPRTVLNDSFDPDDDPEGSNEDSLPLIEDLPHNSYNPRGTNDIYTVFLIVNAALGGGLLNFPKAYDEAGGVIVAVAVQMLLLVCFVFFDLL